MMPNHLMALIEAITLRNNGIRAGLYPLNLDMDTYRKLAADDNYRKNNIYRK